MNADSSHLLLGLALVGSLACAKPEHPKAAAPTPSPHARVDTADVCEGALAPGCVDRALALGPTDEPERAKRALHLLERACSAGDPRGCGHLAAAYLHGSTTGTPPVPDHVLAVAVRACEGHDPVGCEATLTLADELSKGETADIPRAITLYRVACAAGAARGCLAMGHATADGGLEPMHDPERAATYFETACRGDIAEGCAALAIVLAGGRGRPRDDAEARRLATRACDAGASDGCAALAVLEGAGRGGSADLPSAFRAHERACTLGGSQQSLLACARAAHALGVGRGVPRDPARSRAFFERACAPRGEVPGDASCILLAIVSEAGGGTLITEKDEALARALYDHVCARGSGPGCAARGAFFTRRGDRARARADFERACTMGIQESCARAHR